MYHNHIDKDYSHPWYTPDRLDREDEGAARLMHKAGILRFLFPFYGWAIYLYGMPDGSHFFPWSSQRLWKESPTSEYTKCIISTVSLIAWATVIYLACGQDLKNVAYYYGAPWVMLGWWLVAVTYLQHHNPDTVVYDDDDWKFVDSAFETVDRTFGFGIDTLHHHITGKTENHLYTVYSVSPNLLTQPDHLTNTLRRTRGTPLVLHEDPPLQPPNRDKGHQAIHEQERTGMDVQEREHVRFRLPNSQILCGVRFQISQSTQGWSPSSWRHCCPISRPKAGVSALAWICPALEISWREIPQPFHLGWMRTGEDERLANKACRDAHLQGTPSRPYSFNQNKMRSNSNTIAILETEAGTCGGTVI